MFSPVNNNPTKDQAREALEILLDLISTFPFVTDADRAAAISGILTAIIRRSLLTAPGHAVDAPTPGTGKGLLIDICSMICDGRMAGVVSAGKSPEETEKRLGSALLGGDAIIAIDNVNGPFGGDTICSILTQRVVKIRVLGLSKMPDCPTNVSLFVNGNNMVLQGDVNRRILTRVKTH